MPRKQQTVQTLLAVASISLLLSGCKPSATDSASSNGAQASSAASTGCGDSCTGQIQTLFSSNSNTNSGAGQDAAVLLVNSANSNLSKNEFSVSTLVSDSRATPKPIKYSGIDSVNVNIDYVEFMTKGQDSGKVVVAENYGELNLLDMEKGLQINLGTELMTEKFELSQIRLVLGSSGNELTYSNGDKCELTTPSAEESGLKILMPKSIVFEPGYSYSIVIDFDVQHSLVLHRDHAQNACILKPVLRVDKVAKVPVKPPVPTDTKTSTSTSTSTNTYTSTKSGTCTDTGTKTSTNTSTSTSSQTSTSTSTQTNTSTISQTSTSTSSQTSTSTSSQTSTSTSTQTSTATTSSTETATSSTTDTSIATDTSTVSLTNTSISTTTDTATASATNTATASSTDTGTTVQTDTATGSNTQTATTSDTSTTTASGTTTTTSSATATTTDTNISTSSTTDSGTGTTTSTDTSTSTDLNLVVVGFDATTTTNSIFVIWQTTGDPSSSQVLYGLTPDNLNFSTPVDQNLVEVHQMTINELASGTTYYLQPVSIDKFGKMVVGNIIKKTTK